jgi:hypothetical protein
MCSVAPAVMIPARSQSARHGGSPPPQDLTQPWAAGRSVSPPPPSIGGLEQVISAVYNQSAFGGEPRRVEARWDEPSGAHAGYARDALAHGQTWAAPAREPAAAAWQDAVTRPAASADPWGRSFADRDRVGQQRPEPVATWQAPGAGGAGGSIGGAGDHYAPDGYRDWSSRPAARSPGGWDSRDGAGSAVGGGGGGGTGSQHARDRGRRRCVYFSTPRGCRKGSSCPFLHDPTYVATAEELRYAAGGLK